MTEEIFRGVMCAYLECFETGQYYDEPVDFTSNVKIAQALLEAGAIPKTLDGPVYHSTPPINHTTFTRNSVKVLRVLVAAGAPADARLLLRFDHNKHKEVYDLLIRAGASFFDRFEENQTLLHILNGSNSKKTLELLEIGLDPNAIDDGGNTPLHMIALSNLSSFKWWRRASGETIKILLEHGADPNISNNEGKTPLEVAKSEEMREIFAEALAKHDPALIAE